MTKSRSHLPDTSELEPVGCLMEQGNGVLTLVIGQISGSEVPPHIQTLALALNSALTIFKLAMGQLDAVVEARYKGGTDV